MTEEMPNIELNVQEPTAPEIPVQQEASAYAPTYEAPSVPVPQKKDNKKIIVIAAAVIAVLLVVLIVVIASGGNSSGGSASIGSSDSYFSFYNLKTDILAKYPDASVTVGSDGSYMKLDSNPDNIDSDDFTDYDMFFDTNSAIEYANKELGFSEALWEKMQSTSSSMGLQTAESDGFTVSWKYHPDKGMEVMYEKK